MFTPRGTRLPEVPYLEKRRGSLSTGPHVVNLKPEDLQIIKKRKSQISEHAPPLPPGPENPTQQLIRQVWIEEGDLAFRMAETVEKAFQSANKTYRRYQKNPSRDNFQSYLNQVLKHCEGKEAIPPLPHYQKVDKNNKFNIHIATQKNIRRHLLEILAWEWIYSDPKLMKAYQAYKFPPPNTSDDLLGDLVKKALLNRIHFFNSDPDEDKEVTETWMHGVIKAYVADRAEWESRNPGAAYKKPYVDERTRFFFLFSREYHLQQRHRAKQATHHPTPENSEKIAEEQLPEHNPQGTLPQAPSVSVPPAPKTPPLPPLRNISLAPEGEPGKPGTPKMSSLDDKEIKVSSPRRPTIVLVAPHLITKQVSHQHGTIVPIHVDMLPNFFRIFGFAEKQLEPPPRVDHPGGIPLAQKVEPVDNEAKKEKTSPWKKISSIKFNCCFFLSRRSAPVKDSQSEMKQLIIRAHSSENEGKTSKISTNSTDSPILSPSKIFTRPLFQSTPYTEGESDPGENTARLKGLSNPVSGQHNPKESVYNSADFQLSLAITTPEGGEPSGQPEVQIGVSADFRFTH